MALRLRRDVQKASYYVWFLGAEEAKGLRGALVINSVLPYLVDRSRGQEPLKVTLQVSHKGIKIVQGSSKHLIPHSAITSSVQTDDIVACVLLLYNPATKCPLHVHAYRCDSESTAEALHLQLQILINRPDNQKRFEELETRLGILPPLTNSGISSKSISDSHGNKSAGGSTHQSQYRETSGGGSNSGGGGSAQRRHENSPKRFNSSLGSDTGNSTRESECSEEHGLVGAGAVSPISRSPPIRDAKLAQHHQHQQQQLSAQQNTDLFDSLAAELRAKLNGNGPPLLLPPRDYDTVHRSKGNLTAIELRRCRNALIVGGGLRPGVGTAADASAATSATTVLNGKQISSRGSSGIGSDLAPSPERQDLNSSSDDEHWSNEADNSVIALKPSQITMERNAMPSQHVTRKSAIQPPEDNYLRDLPAKPYAPRERQLDRVEARVKSPVTALWTREDDIKPIIMRPTDYDAKFNRMLHSEQRHHGPKSTVDAVVHAKQQDTEKYNEMNRLLNKKVTNKHDKDRDSPEQYQQRYHKHNKSLVDEDDFDDSDPASEHVQSYRKENLTDKQKFIEYTSKKQQREQMKSYAAEETQRYGASSRHRYADPSELPFEQLHQQQQQHHTSGHNKYAAIHHGRLHTPERTEATVLSAPTRHRSHEREHYSRSKERNPYREAESLPYIQSMEKMMKSSAMRYKSFDDIDSQPIEEPRTTKSVQSTRKQTNYSGSASGNGRHDNDYLRDYAHSNSSNVSPRERFKDAKDKFRAMERTNSRYDLTDEGDSNGGCGGDYKPRRRGSIEPADNTRIAYENWSDEDEVAAVGLDGLDLQCEAPAIRSRARARTRDIWRDRSSRSPPLPPSAAIRHELREYRPAPKTTTTANKRDLRHENSCNAYRHEQTATHQHHSSYDPRPGSRGQHERNSRHRDQSREFIGKRDYSPDTMRSNEKNTTASQRHHQHHSDMYKTPTSTPSSSASGAGISSGSTAINPSKHLANMPKGYRHSYAEPVFARTGGRVGLAAVNPF